MQQWQSMMLGKPGLPPPPQQQQQQQPSPPQQQQQQAQQAVSVPPTMIPAAMLPTQLKPVSSQQQLRLPAPMPAVRFAHQCCIAIALTYGVLSTPFEDTATARQSVVVAGGGGGNGTPFPSLYFHGPSPITILWPNSPCICSLLSSNSSNSSNSVKTVTRRTRPAMTMAAATMTARGTEDRCTGAGGPGMVSPSLSAGGPKMAR